MIVIMDEFEQNRILNMLNDIDSDCSDELGIGDENISETEDHLSENDEYATEEELETSDEETDQSERRFLWGKDKLTKWRKDSCQTTGRTRSHNIITQLPGPKLVSRDKCSIIECFKLFCDEIIVRTIVTCTNIYIEKISINFKRQIDCRQTDFQEISALIGILILAGVNKSGKQNIFDLWDTTGFGIESFHATMSIQRFRFLLRCLRFDDIRDRESRREIDKLAPIRDVFEMLVHNCQKSYSVGAFVTIDEELVKFRGKCPFKQYLPSKPGKYGIKIFAVVDSKTMYSLNMEIYPGKQPEGPYNLLNNPHPLVMR
ncbi:piggyBac transposable element-derived protein 4-like, partial [Aphis craccivora]